MSTYALRTAASGSLLNARTRTISLYRKWIRAAPEIPTLYILDFPNSVIRSKIREEFEKNRYVNDLKLIDILIFKGNAELEETMKLWKQVDQLMFYFAKEEGQSKPQTFLGKFYEGRD